MEKLASELNKLIGQSTSGSVTIVIDGSASAPAKINYNEKLYSVPKCFQTPKFGLKQAISIIDFKNNGVKTRKMN
jgi:hypothetical protein